MSMKQPEEYVEYYPLTDKDPQDPAEFQHVRVTHRQTRVIEVECVWLVPAEYDGQAIDEYVEGSLRLLGQWCVPDQERYQAKVYEAYDYDFEWNIDE